MLAPFAGAGLTLAVGFGLSALEGMTSPQEVAGGIRSMGNSAFNPQGLVGMNPLYGGLASIFGNANNASSAQQAYQSLLNAERDPTRMAQLFPTLPYMGEAGMNSPILQAINSYAQQYVNSPSLWGTFSGVNPSSFYQQQQDLIQHIGNPDNGGGG